MDFDLTDEQRLIQETVRAFVDEKVLPNAIENDIEHRLDMVEVKGDIESAVEPSLLRLITNAGQRCGATSRTLVHRDQYDEFAAAAALYLDQIQVGDPRDPATIVGPVIDAAHLAGVQRFVDRALADGAKVVAGGGAPPAEFPDGAFMRPLLLAGLGNESELCQEEFFGPVAQVYRVKDEAEAVELANDTPYGLGSYVMTTDAEQARRVAEKIEAGMVFVNLVGADGAELPFGGVKRSGFGRELGRFGIDEFVNKKLIRIGG